MLTYKCFSVSGEVNDCPKSTSTATCSQNAHLKWKKGEGLGEFLCEKHSRPLLFQQISKFDAASGKILEKQDKNGEGECFFQRISKKHIGFGKILENWRQRSCFEGFFQQISKNDVTSGNILEK